MFDVNLLGLMNPSRIALRYVIAGGGGHIVNISSVLERLRRDGIPHGVRMTTIEPGAVDTEVNHKISNHQVREATLNYVHAVDPVTAEDVSRAVLSALSQPVRVSVNEILLRPSRQEF